MKNKQELPLVKTYSKLNVLAVFLAGTLFLTLAEADEVIGTYLTVISNNDRQSSSGKALKSFEQIIRQDRANYHALNRRDEGDEWDDFFGAAGERAKLETYLKRGNTNRDVKSRVIRYGRDVYISVTIWSRSDGVWYATVGLYGNANE